MSGVASSGLWVLAGAIVGAGSGFLTQAWLHRKNERREERNRLSAAYADFGSAAFRYLRAARDATKAFQVFESLDEKEREPGYDIAGHRRAVLATIEAAKAALLQAETSLDSARCRLLLLDQHPDRRRSTHDIYSSVLDPRRITGAAIDGGAPPQVLSVIADAEASVSGWLLKTGDQLAG